MASCLIIILNLILYLAFGYHFFKNKEDLLANPEKTCFFILHSLTLASPKNMRMLSPQIHLKAREALSGHVLEKHVISIASSCVLEVTTTPCNSGQAFLKSRFSGRLPCQMSRRTIQRESAVRKALGELWVPTPGPGSVPLLARLQGTLWQKVKKELSGKLGGRFFFWSNF